MLNYQACGPTNDAPKHPHMPRPPHSTPRSADCSSSSSSRCSGARANLASFWPLSSRRVRTVSRTNWPQGENKMAGRQSEEGREGRVKGRQAEIYKHCNHGLNIACSPTGSFLLDFSCNSTSNSNSSSSSSSKQAPGGRLALAASICLRESTERAQSSWINHRGQGRDLRKKRLHLQSQL